MDSENLSVDGGDGMEPSPSEMESVHKRTEGGAGEGKVREDVAGDTEERQVCGEQGGDGSVAAAYDQGKSERVAVDEREKEPPPGDKVVVEEKQLLEKTAEIMEKEDGVEATGDLEQVEGVWETPEPGANREKSQSSKNSEPSSPSHPPAPLSAAISSPTHVPSKHTSFQAHLEASSFQPAASSKAPSLIVSLPLSKVELVQHISIMCYSSFHPGDVVWARGAQLPGWPGAVIDHKEWKRDKLKPAPSGKVSGGGKKPWRLSALLFLSIASPLPCSFPTSPTLSPKPPSLSPFLSSFPPLSLFSHQMWIKWFGDETVSLVNEKSIAPLRDGLKRRMKRKTSKYLQRAINLALRAQKRKEKQVCVDTTYYTSALPK